MHCVGKWVGQIVTDPQRRQEDHADEGRPDRCEKVEGFDERYRKQDAEQAGEKVGHEFKPIG